jgi:hypothetical protein
MAGIIDETDGACTGRVEPPYMVAQNQPLRSTAGSPSVPLGSMQGGAAFAQPMGRTISWVRAAGRRQRWRADTVFSICAAGGGE